MRSIRQAPDALLVGADHPVPQGLAVHAAAPGERSGDRTTYRHGYRDRVLDTRLGSLPLRLPKLRQGSCFPPFLDARKTSEKALVAVIQEA
jgi:putative transposase